MENIDNINFDALRRDLINYYGTAAVSVSPIAYMDILRVEQANKYELINIARNCGFDLYLYQIKKKNLLK